MMKLSELIKQPKREVLLVRYDNGFWWLVDPETQEGIDGDRRKRVVLDMAKR